MLRGQASYQVVDTPQSPGDDVTQSKNTKTNTTYCGP
jgi:hypothetical protein